MKTGTIFKNLVFAFMTFAFLLLCQQQVARATFPPTGQFLGPPPMDLPLLLAAIKGDAAALGRFDDIAQPPDGFSPGGQLMVDIIVNALQTQLGLATTRPGGPVETEQPIQSVTQSNPAVVTYTGADSFQNGEAIVISGVNGMTELNGQTFLIANVNAVAKTFELQGINSTTFNAYVSGGNLTTPVTFFLNKVIAGDVPSFLTLQAVFGPNLTTTLNADLTINTEGTFAALGFRPGVIPPPAPPPAVSVSNVGAQALSYIAGGRGKDALRTIGRASSCTVSGTVQVDGSGNPVNSSVTVSCPNATAQNAFTLLGNIFTFCNPGVTDPKQCPNGPTAAASFLNFLPNVLGTVVQTDPNLCQPPPLVINGAQVSPCTPVSTEQIIEAAIADPPNNTAGLAISTTIDRFLNGINPCPPGFEAVPETDANGNPTGNIINLCLGAGNPANKNFIGPAAVDFLNTAATQSGLPPPIVGSGGETPIGAPPDVTILQQLPIPPAGLHNVPTSGSNSAKSFGGLAPDPCGGNVDGYVQGGDYTFNDVKIQKLAHGSGFGTDPCVFTRDKLHLDFAQRFRGGEQWHRYMIDWTRRQWMPALRAMTAQWTASIMNQTLMFGAAIDGAEISKNLSKMQGTEVGIQLGHMPSDDMCVMESAGPSLSAGDANANAMAGAYRRSFTRRAGTGSEE